VRTLRRIEIGPLRDRRLKVGQWRVLTRGEVGELLEATKANASAPPPKRVRRAWSSRPPRRPEDHRGQGSRGPLRRDTAGRRETRR
jgi:hypothetical protein